MAPELGDPDDDAQLRAVAEAQPPFAQFVGMRLVSFRRDEVVGELHLAPELGNRNGVLHGGVIMAFADNLGGTAASLNLPAGTRTTTLESKTNFLRAIPLGQTLRGVCAPLHRGRRTSVWQTTVSDETGRTTAVVTQTQLVVQPDP
ncbi:Phenylacetic acid degradation-related protein [Nocardioides sp. CF8]|uniref:PaaI family thioesterase n=1 Tax=Nocardioides sp. CF8 TaxID=110319 RepID=UPI00032E4C87|nr:PaaI family thioesterase [Nocardioides sp. CF8]EON22169.1 Phenylacetic acid degradation-related protein [Nocardioides sp. CF8]